MRSYRNRIKLIESNGRSVRRILSGCLLHSSAHIFRFKKPGGGATVQPPLPLSSLPRDTRWPLRPYSPSVMPLLSLPSSVDPNFLHGTNFYTEHRTVPSTRAATISPLSGFSASALTARSPSKCSGLSTSVHTTLRLWTRIKKRAMNLLRPPRGMPPTSQSRSITPSRSLSPTPPSADSPLSSFSPSLAVSAFLSQEAQASSAPIWSTASCSLVMRLLCSITSSLAPRRASHTGLATPISS